MFAQPSSMRKELEVFSFWQTQSGNIRFPEEIKYFKTTRPAMGRNRRRKGKSEDFFPFLGDPVCIQQMLSREATAE